MSKVASAVDLLPQWTKRVQTESSGRDPLGLSRFGGALTDYLLQGIITTTTRARYYSFYPWVLWHVEEEGANTLQKFRAAFRKREAFMALATLEHDKSESPVGVLSVQPKLNNVREEKYVNVDFKVLPSNELGGYGQYYSGSLYQLGLTERLENGVDIANEKGRRVAQAYHSAVVNTPYIRRDAFSAGELDYRVLAQSAEAFSLGNVSEAERKILRNILFEVNDHVAADRAARRRETLLLILFALASHSDHDEDEVGEQIDWKLIHGPHYDGRLSLKSNKVVTYTPPPLLQRASLLWGQFAVHQILSHALESLLCGVLEFVRSRDRGATASEICRGIVDDGFMQELRLLAGADCRTPAVLLRHAGVTARPNHSVCSQLRKNCHRLGTSTEQHIVEHRQVSPPVSFAVGCALLALLYGKWRAPVAGDLSAPLAAMAGQELWIGKVLPELDDWLDHSLPWTAALERLVSTCVLEHHDRVMYDKGKLNARWFRRADGRIVFDQAYEPTWRSSRHWNCLRIMADLGLVKWNGRTFSLARDGRALLRAGVSQ